MEVIRAIIVDDELRARRVLTNLLNSNDYNNIEIIAQSSSVLEAVDIIKELQPDVVFLDVQMPKYAGYELVNFFEVINFEIIFVTAFNKYAIKAFELSAVDYLVKPIKRKRLDLAIEKLKIKLDSQNKLEKYETLLKSIKHKNFNKLIISELGNRRIVELTDIIAVEADGSYTTIYLNDNKKITTSKNLKYYEGVFSHETMFFRSHRSWIVNLTFIKTFNRTENYLHLENNIEAKISRNNYESFETFFKNI